MWFARHVFEKRGNNTEAHITESELAAMLAVSFERGAGWSTTVAAMLEAREGKCEPFEIEDLRRWSAEVEAESAIKLTQR